MVVAIRETVVYLPYLGIDLIFARTIISHENNIMELEDSGEALNITGASIREEEVTENAVLNVYGSPITARRIELNRNKRSP